MRHSRMERNFNSPALLACPSFTSNAVGGSLPSKRYYYGPDGVGGTGWKIIQIPPGEVPRCAKRGELLPGGPPKLPTASMEAPSHTVCVRGIIYDRLGSTLCPVPDMRAAPGLSIRSIIRSMAGCIVIQVHLMRGRPPRDRGTTPGIGGIRV